MLFSKPPQCILRENLSGDGHLSVPGVQWLPGACVNPARNCLSLNSKRSLNDTMVIWRDEGKDDLPLNKMTLKELCAEVWYAIHDPLSFVLLKSFPTILIDLSDFIFLMRSSLDLIIRRLVAHALQALGLEKGSAIAIDMPMNVISIVIYLAIVLAGYVVVSIADSFAPPEISTRLKISEAKAIFTQVHTLLLEKLNFFSSSDYVYSGFINCTFVFPQFLLLCF